MKCRAAFAIAMTCLTFAVSYATAAESELSRRAREQAIPKNVVSMYRILANPEFFDGKRVAVWGFISIGDGFGILWPNSTSLEKRPSVDGIYLSLDEKQFDSNHRLDRHWVMIEGEFAAQKFIERPGFAGTLKPVIRILQWD